MTDEIYVGDVTVVTNVGENDTVLIVQKGSGALVGASVDTMRRQTTRTVLPATNEVLTAGGVASAAGVPVVLKSGGQAGKGVSVDAAGVMTIDVIDILFGNTPTAKRLLNRDAADGLYAPKSSTDRYDMATRVNRAGHGLVDGTPVRWDGTKWDKVGRYVSPLATPQVDEWVGVAQKIDNDNFFVVSAGRVTIESGTVGAASAATTITNGGSTPATTLTFSGMVAGKQYYWLTIGANSGWVDIASITLPFDAFRGKIQAISATEAIVLPFKSRSASLFRPVQTSPDGAGRINVIRRLPGTTAGLIFCGGTGSPVPLFRSDNNGETWSPVAGPITGTAGSATFNSVQDISIVRGRIYVSLGANGAGNSVAANWIRQMNLDGTGLANGTAFGTLPISAVRRAFVFGSYVYALISGNAFMWRHDTNNFPVSAGPSLTNPAQSNYWDWLTPGGTILYILAGFHLYKLNGNVSFSGQSAPVKTFTGETATRRMIAVGATLFVASDSGKVYRANDYNATPVWNSGVQVGSSTVVNDLVSSTSGLYAATDDGIYRSQDNGDNWQKVFGGQPVTALALNDAGKVVAGTADGKMLIEN